MKHFGKHISVKFRTYQNAMSASAYDHTLIAAGTQENQFRDDIPIPYTVNAYFREWLPLSDRPDSFLLISTNRDKPTLLLKTVADFWHSESEILPSEITSAIDVVEYATTNDLQQLIPAQGKIAFIGLETAIPKGVDNLTINPQALLDYVDYHRAWKNDYEMDCLRQANTIAIRGHIAAEKAFRDGSSEFDINMAYLSAVNCQEKDLPYPNIVALNENGAVLHHFVLGKKKPSENKSFLIDAGAQYNGYTSDITRTYINNNQNDTFAELIKRTDDIQKRLVSELKPGNDYAQLHVKAHQYIANILADLRIIKISPEEAVDLSLTNAFFPHGLGHLIGAQVHDKGGHLASTSGDIKSPSEKHPFLRCTRTIEENMAFTIEPGIYFIPMLLDPWSQKTSILNMPLINDLIPYGGIRIEDDLIVHKSHAENMTRDAFGKTCM